jgi:hypothetical protein
MTLRNEIATGGLLITFVIAPLPSAHAHHSTAIYDRSQVVTVEGVVTAYEWSNPHVYIYVEQKTNTGETIEWEVEGNPPAILRRQGWSADTLRAGDSIVVTGNPSRSANSRSLAPTSVQRDGATLYGAKEAFARLASSGAAPSVATDLNGTWVALLPQKLMPLLSNPAANLQLTEKGAAAVKSYDDKTMNPGIDCVPFPAPVFMIVPDVKRIATDGGLVRIAGELDGAERIVHLGLDTHEGATASVQGHSIGRWEDKTLVIDTTHFADHAVGNANGLPGGSRKHLLERLTLNDAGTGVAYHFELSDPEFLAAPMTGDVEWAYRPDLVFAAVPCNLENARRFIAD